MATTRTRTTRSRTTRKNPTEPPEYNPPELTDQQQQEMHATHETPTDADRASAAAHADARIEEALDDAPKKTRLERQAEKGQESYDKLVKAWLDAENIQLQMWLDAETKWQTDVTAWLDGEARYTTAQELYDTVRTSAASATEHLMLGQSFLDEMLDAVAKIKDGGYFKDLGFAKYIDFVSHVCKTYVGQLDGGSKKVVVRFVVAQIPGLSQRKYEEVTGIPQAQISRAVNDSDAGDGDQGHGGSRKTKREITKLAEALQRSDQPEGKPDPLQDDDKWTNDELKQTERELWRKLIDIREEMHKRGLTLPPLAEPEYGQRRSRMEGSGDGTTDAARDKIPA